MAKSHRITKGWQQGSSVVSETVTRTAESELNMELTIANSSIDTQVAVNFTASQLVSVFMLSDENLRVEVNNSSSALVFELKADSPFIWESQDSYFSNPFTTNVSAFYVTNTSGASATFTFNTLIDPTP